MWKTGFPASMKGWKVEHSDSSTHCSLTEKWTRGRTEGMMSPAFLRPRERLRGVVMLERKVRKEIESVAVRERPFLFC